MYYLKKACDMITLLSLLNLTCIQINMAAKASLSQCCTIQEVRIKDLIYLCFFFFFLKTEVNFLTVFSLSSLNLLPYFFLFFGIFYRVKE